MLLGLDDAGRSLDQRLGTETAPGLAEVLAGEAKLTEVAHRAADQGFLYLPAGRTPDHPPSLLPALLDRVRRAGGTLLLAVTEDRADLPAGWSDAEIRLARDEPIGPSPSERWRRHRLEKGLPRGRSALAAGALIALLGGWWILARVVTAWAPDSSTGMLDARSVGGAVDPAAQEDGVDAAPVPAESLETADRMARLADYAAPELGYSVLVASYGRFSDAMRHLEAVAGAPGLFFIAPTRVRERLYYRLFAGALPTHAAASTLMSRLVDDGLKEESSDWDVRPAGLGFRVSIHAAPDEAEAAQRELAANAVPTYVIPLVADADTVHQVYAGAYERPAAATDMRALLARAGQDAELIPRRGEPR